MIELYFSTIPWSLHGQPVAAGEGIFLHERQAQWLTPDGRVRDYWMPETLYADELNEPGAWELETLYTEPLDEPGVWMPETLYIDELE